MPPPLVVVRGFDTLPSPYVAGHRGVDLRAPLGGPVQSAGAGSIGFAGQVAGRGVVSVVHGELRTTYEPVAAAVAAGELVRPGQLIGHVSGLHPGCPPPGACLHWGLLRGETYLDPLGLLRRGPSRLLPRYGAGASAAAAASTVSGPRAPLVPAAGVAGVTGAAGVAGAGADSAAPTGAERASPNGAERASAPLGSGRSAAADPSRHTTPGDPEQRSDPGGLAVGVLGLVGGLSLLVRSRAGTTRAGAGTARRRGEPRAARGISPWAR